MATILRARAAILAQDAFRQSSKRAVQRSSNSAFIRQLRFEDRVVRPAFIPRRWHSVPASDSKVYEFKQIQQMSESPVPERILIDVREPSELQDGYIPSAINIPIKSQPDALLLPEDEFEDRFGFEKPPMDKEVVFYCRSGVRSSAAAQLAHQHGYQNVAEYRGSWLDWQERGGAASKP